MRIKLQIMLLIFFGLFSTSITEIVFPWEAVTVASNEPYFNIPGYYGINIWREPGRASRAYIQFNYPTMHKNISNIFLNIYLRQGYYDEFYIYSVPITWNYSSIHWNNQPCGNIEFNYGICNKYISSSLPKRPNTVDINEWRKLDVTSLGPNLNYLISIEPKLNSEIYSGLTTGVSNYASCEEKGTNCTRNIPYLEVTYEWVCDGGIANNQCNSIGQKCVNGTLVMDCATCGCPNGQGCLNNQCVKKCAEGVLLNQCSGQMLCTESGLQNICGKCNYNCCNGIIPVGQCNGNQYCTTQGLVLECGKCGYICCGSTPLNACNGNKLCTINGLITECGKCGYVGCIGNQYCENNVLKNDCRYCNYNCNVGFTCAANGTCAPSCHDSTIINTCSKSIPLFCNSQKQLIENCTTCGCPENYVCMNNGNCEFFNYSVKESQLSKAIVGSEGVVFEKTINGTGYGNCNIDLPSNFKNLNGIIDYSKENQRITWKCNFTNNSIHKINYTLPAPIYEKNENWNQPKNIHVGEKVNLTKRITVKNIANQSVNNVSLFIGCELNNCSEYVIGSLYQNESKNITFESEVYAVQSSTANLFDYNKNGYWFIDNWTNNLNFTIFNISRDYYIPDCIPSSIEVLIEGINVTNNDTFVSLNGCNISVFYPVLAPKQLLDPDIFYQTYSQFPNPSSSITPTPSPTPTITTTPTPSPNATTPTPSPTPTPTVIITPTPTVTSTPSPTYIPSSTPTIQPSIIIFPSPTIESPTPTNIPETQIIVKRTEIVPLTNLTVGKNGEFKIIVDNVEAVGNAKFTAPDGRVFYQKIENGTVIATFDMPGEWIISFRNQIAMKFLVFGNESSYASPFINPQTMLVLASTSKDYSIYVLPILIILALSASYLFLKSPKIVFKKNKGKEVKITIKNNTSKKIKNLKVSDLIKGKTNAVSDEKRNTIFGEMLIWKKETLEPGEVWNINYSSDCIEVGNAELIAEGDSGEIKLSS